MGTDTENFPKSPRGVRGFQLNTGNFSTWKLQGKIGGYTEYVSVPFLSCTLYSPFIMYSFETHNVLLIGSLTSSVAYLMKADFLVNVRVGISLALTPLHGPRATSHLVYPTTRPASASL